MPCFKQASFLSLSSVQCDDKVKPTTPAALDVNIAPPSDPAPPAAPTPPSDPAPTADPTPTSVLGVEQGSVLPQLHLVSDKPFASTMLWFMSQQRVAQHMI